MSYVPETYPYITPRQLPLLVGGDPCRVLAWRDGRAVSAAQFLHRFASTLRAHYTEQVLRDLAGYDDERIASLRASGAIA